MKNLILFEKSNRVQQEYSTCPRDAFETLSTCPRYLFRIALILCVLVLGVGQTWGM